MLALTRSAFDRARDVRLPQAAASLTLTTALSIVPLLAVAFALFRRFPVFAPLESAIEQHLLKSLFPLDIAGTVLEHLHRFAANASGLTLAGSLLVLGAAVMMILTVEGALDQMWKAKRARPLTERVRLYVVMLTVAPALIGVLLWSTAAVLDGSMSWLRGGPRLLFVTLDLVPIALCSAALASLFHWLPHARVRWRDAIAGAVLGAVALDLGKRAFAAYLIHGPTYRSLYGAFATLPVFLLWLYFSWLVTLSAALVTARLGRSGGRSRARPLRPPPRARR